MKSGRFISGALLIVWLILSIAPAGFALQNDHCLICTKKSCPVEKVSHPSCHENQKATALKFEACNCQHNSFLFTFDAVMPEINFESHEVIALLTPQAGFFQSFVNPQNNTPPPKPLAAWLLS
jgi:hypothetical protein